MRPHKPFQRLLYLILGLGVKAAGGLVQNYNPRVMQNGSRDCDTLALLRRTGYTRARPHRCRTRSGKWVIKSWALAIFAALITSIRRRPGLRSGYSQAGFPKTGRSPAAPPRFVSEGCFWISRLSAPRQSGYCPRRGRTASSKRLIMVDFPVPDEPTSPIISPLSDRQIDVFKHRLV